MQKHRKTIRLQNKASKALLANQTKRNKRKVMLADLKVSCNTVKSVNQSISKIFAK